MNDIKSITLPAILEKQKALVKGKMEEARTHAADSSATKIDSLATADDDPKESFDEKQKKVDEMLKLSDFSKTWIVRFGYVGVFSAVLYILGGIFLLVRKSFSIKLAYAVLIFSILSSAVQAAVLTSGESSGIIALSTGLSQLLGVVVDIILIAIIFASDKEAYSDQNLS